MAGFPGLGVGLFVSTVYVLRGWMLIWAMTTKGQLRWALPASAGFPILGLSIACGFHEMPRRRAEGMPLTVVAIPMLLDREVDFVTAMITSVSVVRENPVTMMIWGAMIALAIFAAMVPWLLGVFVVLPVLGHASWHLYRKALQ